MITEICMWMRNFIIVKELKRRRIIRKEKVLRKFVAKEMCVIEHNIPWKVVKRKKSQT